jgi:lipid-A-disaccharide synthase
MPLRLFPRLKKAAKNSRSYAENTGTKLALIIAGEASADLHGSNLVKAIKRLDENITFTGIGGELMKRAGVDTLFSSSDMAVVGATEAISKIKTIYKASKTIKSILKSRRPDLLILIDYPEFNIHIAHTAKKAKVPVLYFISPQIWAWRKGRVRKIARRVDRMAVILPFEEDFYNKWGMSVDYVGHPIIDGIPSEIKKPEVIDGIYLNKEFPVIGLVPGSREEEVRRMLPPMIKASEILKNKFPDLRCILPLAPTVSPDLIRSIISDCSIRVSLYQGNIYELLSVCHAAMVTSGTATLETALMGVPMVVAYKLSILSYWLGRLLIDVPFISLANLVAGEKVVTELIQKDVTPEKIAEEILVVLEDQKARDVMISKMGTMRNRLGGGGATERTAKIAVDMIETE